MLLRNSFSGGTNSSTITTGNSGGTSGDAFNLVTGTPTFTTSQATGGRSPLVAQVKASTDELTWNGLTLAARTIYIRAYIYIAASPSSADFFIYCDGTSSTPFVIYMDTSRRLSVRRGSATTDFAKQTGSVPTGQWCRVEARVDIGTTTSNSACEIRRYDSADSTTASETTTASSINLGTQLPVAITYSYSDSLTYLYDDVGVSDVDWLGPTVTSTDVPATDTGALTEQSGIALAGADAAVLAELASTAAAAAVVDAGAVGEAAGISTAGNDVAVVGDQSDLAVAVATSDGAVLGESADVTETGGPAPADAVTLDDSAVLAVAAGASDGATATDTALVDAALAVSDAASVVEAAQLVLLVADVAGVAEAAGVGAALATADAVLVAEAAGAGQPIAVSDSAALGELAMVTNVGRDITAASRPWTTWAVDRPFLVWAAGSPTT